MHMKTRVTITLDPRIVRRAKAVARLRRTNLSALIEDLLARTAEEPSVSSERFSQKWAGKLALREDEADPLLAALKARYNIPSR